MDNFICFGGMFKLRYWYFDTKEYLTDSVFAKNKIDMRYVKEYEKENEPYLIVECKIQKKYKDRFESALREVTNKMLLIGHTDYEEYCQKAINAMKG